MVFLWLTGERVWGTMEKSLPLRGRWHGEAVSEGVRKTPSVSLRLTAPSEREPFPWVRLKIEIKGC